MNKLKKYIKITLTWIIMLIIYTFILLILNYTQVLKFNSLIKLNIIIMLITIFIIGILNGKTAQKKGYIEGIKLGSIISSILLLLNIIFIRKFSLYTLLYYLSIIISTTIGSMIGINIKRK